MSLIDLDRTSTHDRTVWVAHSFATVAAEVAERLHGLGLDVRLWDADSSRPPRGLVVSDAASLDTMLSGFHGPAHSAPPKPVWRGGLAPGALRRVKERIEASLADRISLDQLAKIAGLSGCHFSRAFRQSVGVPPHRYILSRRIAAAARLIEETNRALIDIALACGFSDHSHFTRSFVRITGETPREYRRRHR